MKTFRSEISKPRIWIDPGVMISLESDDISAVLYRKGLFSGWKVINESTSPTDVEFTLSKIDQSWGKSIRTMGRIQYLEDPDWYRRRAMNLVHDIRGI